MTGPAPRSDSEAPQQTDRSAATIHGGGRPLERQRHVEQGHPTLQRHRYAPHTQHARRHRRGRGRRRAEGRGPHRHSAAATGGGTARQGGGPVAAHRHDVQPRGGEDPHAARGRPRRRLDGPRHPRRVGWSRPRLGRHRGGNSHRARHLHLGRARGRDGPGRRRARTLRPAGGARLRRADPQLRRRRGVAVGGARRRRRHRARPRGAAAHGRRAAAQCLRGPRRLCRSRRGARGQRLD